MERIGKIIGAYDKQGIHRTGSDVDSASADWLAGEFSALGVTPERSTYSLNRVDVVTAAATVNGATLDGLPRFDGGATGPNALTGKLGPIGSDAPIGLAKTNPRSTPEVEEIRRSSPHQAIIQITDGGRAGLCPINADSFTDPFGPPVLQVSNEHSAELEMAAATGDTVSVTVDMTRTPSTSDNIVGRIAGRDPALAPLVVMTPRSGWWSCASERGGGLVVLLEIMRTLSTANPDRSVIFTANSGHELGHLGLDHFIAQNDGIVPSAHCWIHLGANFGSGIDGKAHLQASEKDLLDLGRAQMQEAGAPPEYETPLDQRPRGEARNIFDHGGRYVSLLGENGLFHNPDDHWPDAIDVDKTARLAKAFSAVAVALSAA